MRCRSTDGEADKIHPRLQSLKLNDQGLLIDEKTGEVINEAGATRFDVAVRAIRGEFSPSLPQIDNERTPGLLIDSLLSFPTMYDFNIVIKNTESEAPQDILEQLKQVIAQECEEFGKCTMRERKSGKYLSFSISALVAKPESIYHVLAQLDKNSRIVMKY